MLDSVLANDHLVILHPMHWEYIIVLSARLQDEIQTLADEVMTTEMRKQLDSMILTTRS